MTDALSLRTSNQRSKDGYASLPLFALQFPCVCVAGAHRLAVFQFTACSQCLLGTVIAVTAGRSRPAYSVLLYL